MLPLEGRKLRWGDSVQAEEIFQKLNAGSGLLRVALKVKKQVFLWRRTRTSASVSTAPCSMS